MSHRSAIDNTAILLLIIGLIVGSVGTYFVTTPPLTKTIREKENQMEDLVNQITESGTDISALSSTVSSLEEIIQDYEEQIQELVTEISNYQDEISNLQIEKISLQNHILSLEDQLETFRNLCIRYDDFEDTTIGGLPDAWYKIGGTAEDTVQVENNQAYQSRKSLMLHENGDSKNCRVETRIRCYSDLIFETWFRIYGSNGSRAAIKLKNEHNQSTISITCIIGDNWKYLSSGGWIKIDSSPRPVANRWYHVKIVVDGEVDSFKVYIDQFESDWIYSLEPWDTIDSLEFRGNSHYPSDSWYDNIVIKIES